MNDIKYSTNEEKRLNIALQEAVNAYPNAIIGTQTMTDIAVKLGLKHIFPLTVKMYGHPTIMGNDIILFSPQTGISGYANSMLGSFTDKRGVTPCSIMVANKKAICGFACHAFLNKPESVIYKTESGKVGITRAMYSTDLPSKTVTAIGGMGLIDNYDPATEGFTGAYADVLRKTNHNVIGYKNGMWYGVYFANLTGKQINEIVKTKFKFEFALLLDGGGLAAMNGAESFAKINTKTQQGYAVQFV